MSNFDQTKYVNDYKKNKYDTLKVEVPKGQKEIILDHANGKGFKSINAYLKHLIDKDLNSK